MKIFLGRSEDKTPEEREEHHRTPLFLILPVFHRAGLSRSAPWALCHIPLVTAIPPFADTRFSNEPRLKVANTEPLPVVTLTCRRYLMQHISNTWRRVTGMWVCQRQVPQHSISRSNSSCSGVLGFFLQCFGTNVGRGICRKRRHAIHTLCNGVCNGWALGLVTYPLFCPVRYLSTALRLHQG